MLTRDDLPVPVVLEYRAGRELDALVAEKLGVCLHPKSKRSREGVPDYKSANILRCACGFFLHKDSEKFEPPPYSTSISAALSLVDKYRALLAPDGLHYFVQMFDLRDRWFVKICHTWASGDGEAETLPLAICRAALKAVGA